MFARTAHAALALLAVWACSSTSSNEAVGGSSGTSGTAGSAGGGTGGTGAVGGTGAEGGDAATDASSDADAGCGWSARFGGAGADVRYVTLSTDSNGYLLVAGQFKGSIDFGGGTLTSPSNAYYDGFLLKLDSKGKHVWSKRLADSATAEVAGIQMRSDPKNDIYVSFKFKGAAKLGSGSSLNAVGGWDIGIGKLTSSGDHLWSRSIGGSGDESGGLLPLADGNVALHGDFTSASIALDGDGGVLTNTNTANADAFLARLGSSGGATLVKLVGSTGNEVVFGTGTAFPDSSTLLMLSTSGDLDQAGANCSPLTGAGTVMAKLSTTGSCGYQVHAKPAADAGAGVLALWYAQATSTGGAVVAGAVSGQFELGGKTLASHGDFDLALIRIDTMGQVTQALAFGDEQYQEIGGLAVDGSGNAVLAGYSNGSIDFGTGKLVSAGDNDVFLGKFASNGKAVASQRFGDASYQDVTGLAFGSDGKLLATGTFAGNLDFGHGASLAVLGSHDLWVAELCL